MKIPSEKLSCYPVPSKWDFFLKKSDQPQKSSKREARTNSRKEMGELLSEGPFAEIS
jgi:hypothetical protein